MSRVGPAPALGSWRERLRGRRIRASAIILVLVALAAAGWSSEPGAAGAGSGQRPVPGAVAAGAGSVQRRVPGALAGPVRLIPTGRDPITVGDHSYWGSLELRAAGDGLIVVNRLSLERYLLGLQEVPLTWPDEALKAQAVAARTYALKTLAGARAGAAATYGFDICASVECQVYSGADVLASLGGARWLQAVRDTAGVAVLYDDEPILARYHSTSGGVTLDNPQVFTSEPGYPYLQGVASTTERRSPLYRWRVDFPLRRVQAIIETAGWWSDGGRLRSVRSVPSASGRHYPDLVFCGRNGRLVRTAEEFRTIARTIAPSRWPNRYPSTWSTQSGRLPETLPSNRVAVITRGRRVIVHGRGWGHGVGMSQWGAEGLARSGASYEEILRHYYTGVEVAEYGGPGRISVGIDWAESSVEAAGAFSIIDGRGRTVVDDALGAWTFTHSGPDVVGVDPPAGFGLPLRVGIVDAPDSVAPGAVATVTIALSRPARVRATTDGSAAGRAAVAEAGRYEVEWLAPDDPGDYRVQVEASSGRASRRSEAVEIAVRDESRDGSSESAGSDRERPQQPGNRTGLYIVIAGLAALLVVAIALVRRWPAGRIER